MRLRHLAVLGLSLAAGACAAAVPGYVPPSAKTEKFKAAAPRGGGFDAAGAYSLTEQEQALDCKGLTGSMTIKIIQMRDAGNRVKPSAMASTAQGAIRPLFGGTTTGQSIEDDLRRDRARLETMNRQLAVKSCPVFDIEAELKPGNTQNPKPVKTAKAK